MCLLTYVPSLRNSSVEIRTDNITARSYLIHQGGPESRLNAIARAIWCLASKNNIFLQCIHLSGILNREADALSRLEDKFNWRVSTKTFAVIEELFGPHSVDRFADLSNSHLIGNNSRYWDPCSEGVNALAQDWSGETNYCCPPFRLIPAI